METIRTQNREVQFAKAVMLVLLSPDEIKIIRSASDYNEDTGEYRVPLFTFKEKSLKFPKL